MEGKISVFLPKVMRAVGVIISPLMELVVFNGSCLHDMGNDSELVCPHQRTKSTRSYNAYLLYVVALAMDLGNFFPQHADFIRNWV